MHDRTERTNESRDMGYGSKSSFLVLSQRKHTQGMQHTGGFLKRSDLGVNAGKVPGGALAILILLQWNIFVCYILKTFKEA